MINNRRLKWGLLIVLGCTSIISAKSETYTFKGITLKWTHSDQADPDNNKEHLKLVMDELTRVASGNVQKLFRCNREVVEESKHKHWRSRDIKNRFIKRLGYSVLGFTGVGKDARKLSMEYFDFLSNNKLIKNGSIWKSTFDGNASDNTRLNRFTDLVNRTK